MTLDIDSSADLLTDVRAAILEELDFPIKCIVRVMPFIKVGNLSLGIAPISEPCQNDAVAVVRCRACGAAGCICNEHRAYVLQQSSVTCVGCMASGPALVVYSFSPIV